MEKKMEHEMETGFRQGHLGDYECRRPDNYHYHLEFLLEALDTTILQGILARDAGPSLSLSLDWIPHFPT